LNCIGISNIGLIVVGSHRIKAHSFHGFIRFVSIHFDTHTTAATIKS
jgi:hypothetical protein